MKFNVFSLGFSAFAFIFSSLLMAAPVNINKASASEIASALTGIGEAKAKMIVSYRKKNGAFKKVADLENVKGIGKATIKKNKGDILLK